MDVYCPFVLNCNSFCSIECAELDDLLAVLEEGLKNRAIGTHNMNEHSSRSHTILTVHIHRWDRITLFKHSNSHQILQRRESFKWWQQRSLYHEVGQSFRIVQNWITRHCKTFSWSDRNGLEHQFSKIFTTFYVFENRGNLFAQIWEDSLCWQCFLKLIIVWPDTGRSTSSTSPAVRWPRRRRARARPWRRPTTSTRAWW